MIGITRSCKHPDDAWKAIEFLDFSPTGLESRAPRHQQPASPARLLEHALLP